MDISHRKVLEGLGGSIAEVCHLSGGSVGEVWRCVFESGRVVVAKSSGHGSLDIEAWMLQYLADKGVRVPEVFHVSDNFLVMEYIDSVGSVDIVDLVGVMGGLHSIRGGAFGLERDTMIGSVVQPNGWMDSWVDFYVERRLLYVGREALGVGAVGVEFMRGLEVLCGKLGGLLGGVDSVLVHGDLWFGNVVGGFGGVVLIDPAIYYGDCEVDVVFACMFGGVGDGFLGEYDRLIGLSDNFGEKRLVYELYMLLVHARLFGGSYGAQADSIVKKFI